MGYKRPKYCVTCGGPLNGNRESHRATHAKRICRHPTEPPKVKQIQWRKKR